MKKVFIKTYGCQMNERDSEQVAADLVKRGYSITGSEAEADIILLNTCSIRDSAEQKALSKMGFLAKRLKRGRPATLARLATASKRGEAGKPEVVLGFLGCMAQRRGEELLDRMPDVDLVVGTQKFHRVADYVGQLCSRESHSRWDRREETTIAATPTRVSGRGYNPIVDIAEEEGSESTIRDHLPQNPPNDMAGKPTAFVSIMQGCDMHCTFCIVPATRGAERSRSIEEIVIEVRELVAQGVKEVTLLGQIVTSYGRKTNVVQTSGLRGNGGQTGTSAPHKVTRPFVQLLEALDEIGGLKRVRITSPHPLGFGDDLINCYGQLRTLCESVHLPVQSGSNSILKAMKRSYTVEKYLRIVDKLRARVPDIALSTDIIVGFPGETDADFSASRRLVEQVQFDEAFVFKYSSRSGTLAAEMPDQVTQRVKEARNQELLALLEEISARKHAAQVGQTVEVLVEGPSEKNPHRMFGRTRHNDAVIFDGARRHIGQLVPVWIMRATASSLYGDAVVVGLDGKSCSRTSTRVPGSPSSKANESAANEIRGYKPAEPALVHAILS